MTKKDCFAIARALYHVKTEATKASLVAACIVVADITAKYNPHLSRDLFLEICETGKCNVVRE